MTNKNHVYLVVKTPTGASWWQRVFLGKPKYDEDRRLSPREEAQQFMEWAEERELYAEFKLEEITKEGGEEDVQKQIWCWNN